jgi:hypothetical protein
LGSKKQNFFLKNCAPKTKNWESFLKK